MEILLYILCVYFVLSRLLIIIALYYLTGENFNKLSPIVWIYWLCPILADLRFIEALYRICKFFIINKLLSKT